MNFFSRTKIFFRILCVLSAVDGVLLLLQLFKLDLKDISLNPEMYIPLYFIAGLFVVLLLLTIALKCIITDAQEDLTSAFNVKSDINKE